MLLFKGGVLIYAEHCIYIYIYIYIGLRCDRIHLSVYFVLCFVSYFLLVIILMLWCFFPFVFLQLISVFCCLVFFYGCNVNYI